MNKRTFVKLALAVVLVGAFAISAAAGDSTISANIPFGFQVAGQQMPAGLYRVTEFHGKLLIRSADNRFGALVSGIPVESAVNSTPKLVFNRYGDRYFAAHIVLNDAQAITLPTSKAEAEYLANAAPTQVAVAGN